MRPPFRQHLKHSPKAVTNLGTCAVETLLGVWTFFLQMAVLMIHPLPYHGCSLRRLLCFADPFLNDVNFLLSVLTLEEGGATGNKVRTIYGVLCIPRICPVWSCLKQCSTAVCTTTLILMPCTGTHWTHHQPCPSKWHRRPCHISYCPRCHRGTRNAPHRACNHPKTSIAYQQYTEHGNSSNSTCTFEDDD